jgi:hypothetical protein
MTLILTRSSDKLNQIDDPYVQDRLRERGVETLALEDGDKLLAIATIYSDFTCDFILLEELSSLGKLKFLKEIKKSLKLTEESIFAFCKKEGIKENRLLEWLGFDHAGEIHEYNGYICQHKQQ